MRPLRKPQRRSDLLRRRGVASLYAEETSARAVRFSQAVRGEGVLEPNRSTYSANLKLIENPLPPLARFPRYHERASRHYGACADRIPRSEFDRNIGAFSGKLKTSKQKIHKTLFGTVPFAYVLFAEASGHEVGFALYGFRYSSFAGQPSIWLDDLYVDADKRSQGAGTALMDKLAQIAAENNCTHLAWNADARNIRGLNFYRRLGAEIIEQKENLCFLQWIPQALIN